jgi:YD repeat-containing protein
VTRRIQVEKFRIGRLAAARAAVLRLGAALCIATPLPLNAQTYSQTEVLTYHDNAAKWVLGQVAKREINNVVVEETSFTSDSLPHMIRSFGALKWVASYNTDGTLSSLQDANGYATGYGAWKRGVPQLVSYADTTAQHAVVNDQGFIEAYVDELGNQTSLTYDAMGRLASTTPPADDAQAWNPTSRNFEQVGIVEFGIAAGHWRQTTSSGAARRIIYFNTYWQPLLIQEYDAADQAATQRFQRFAYDAEGRRVFASYPSTSSAPTTGTWTTYDALGRTASVSVDSDSGALSTLTSYLPGHQTQTTDPRGLVTITSYQAFDQPSYDSPTLILAPEGARTSIVRDVFGKPLSITRSNDDGSVAVTRSYVYQADQQLCKSIEPEAGVTVYGYDLAGNVTASATGLTQASFGSTASCDQDAAWSSGRAVSRTYDTRNRLKTLIFPDGRGNQAWNYTADGLPELVTTYNSANGDAVVNSYSYNHRRLLIGEDMSQPGADTASMDYGYDANANMALQMYPSGLSVSYAPNALGQPTQAGSYASGVLYHPNGAIKQFTYGNGIVHTMTQNGRQLPARSTDGAAMDMGYDFDADGNVASITDYVDSNRSRSMSYDGQNRLLTTSSVMFGGDNQAVFTYDVLDNLKTFKVGSAVNYQYNYNGRQQLELATNLAPGGQDVGIGYDAQGNVVNRNGQLFDFDYGNRLRLATNKESYRYDANGRRVLNDSPTLGKIFSLYGQDGVLRRQQDQRTGKNSEYVYLGGSLVARVINAQALPVPSTSVPASSTNGLYTVTWTPTANTTSYQIQEKVGSAGAWTGVYTGTNTTLTVSGKGDGAYSYRAKSCLYANCGAWSNEATIAVQLVPASAPSITSPGTAIGGNFTVTWSSVANSNFYKLEQQLGAGAWSEVSSGADLSKSFSSLAAGTYGYRVRACGTGGCGSYSGLTQTTVIYVPATPAAPTTPASSANGAYMVGWTAVTNASEYRLEESGDGGTWMQLVAGNVTSQAVSGRASGSYSYRVRACNTAGCSSYSSPATTTVLLPPSTAPAVTAPGTNSTGSYTVSWSAVGGAASYELQENDVTGYSGTSTSTVISGKGNGSYQYKARACNSSGCGPWSSTATTQVLLPPSGVPSLSAPSTNNSGSYAISWSGVANATSYELQENGGTVFNSSGTSYTVGGKGAGSYQYTVRACNPSGCSGWSASVTTVVTLVPPTPTGLNAQVETVSYKQKRFTAWWDAAPNATSYQLIGYMTYNGPALSTTMLVNISSFPTPTPQYQVRACNAYGCSPYSQIVYSGQE